MDGNYYISWTDYGPIIVQSQDQIEERKVVQDVSLVQNQSSEDLEHSHSYMQDPDLDQDDHDASSLDQSNL